MPAKATEAYFSKLYNDKGTVFLYVTMVKKKLITQYETQSVHDVRSHCCLSSGQILWSARVPTSSQPATSARSKTSGWTASEGTAARDTTSWPEGEMLCNKVGSISPLGLPPI